MTVRQPQSSTLKKFNIRDANSIEIDTVRAASSSERFSWNSRDKIINFSRSASKSLYEAETRDE